MIPSLVPGIQAGVVGLAFGFGTVPAGHVVGGVPGIQAGVVGLAFGFGTVPAGHVVGGVPGIQAGVVGVGLGFGTVLGGQVLTSPAPDTVFPPEIGTPSPPGPTVLATPLGLSGAAKALKLIDTTNRSNKELIARKDITLPYINVRIDLHSYKYIVTHDK